MQLIWMEWFMTVKHYNFKWEYFTIIMMCFLFFSFLFSVTCPEDTIELCKTLFLATSWASDYSLQLCAICNLHLWIKIFPWATCMCMLCTQGFCLFEKIIGIHFQVCFLVYVLFLMSNVRSECPSIHKNNTIERMAFTKFYLLTKRWGEFHSTAFHIKQWFNPYWNWQTRNKSIYNLAIECKMQDPPKPFSSPPFLPKSIASLLK